MTIALAVGAVLLWANVDVCFAMYKRVEINYTPQLNGLCATITQEATNYIPGKLLLVDFGTKTNADGGVTYLTNRPNAVFNLMKPDESETDKTDKVVHMMGHRYAYDAQFGHCVEVDWTY